MTAPSKQLIESEYEVKLGVFEGPLDLLLYLVQKNELNPREIQISVITDQYLAYIDTIKDMNLANAGEFLVMAARLMRLKARELLPADQKDELEDMEYELDRQALIQQMLEYQKFKEAARVLRNHESRHFGAFGRGRSESPDDKNDAELEEEAGVFDLLAAFRNVVLSKPKAPVHEVEIDDVTIEDRMQEVEITLNELGRSLFEDLFANDTRTISLVVTFMSILELAKLDRIVFRQSHALGPIWVYRKQKASDYEMELKVDESHLEPLPEFKEGLVDLIKEQMKTRTVANALEEALRDLENGIMPGDAPAAEAPVAGDAAPAAAAPVAPTESGSAAHPTPSTAEAPETAASDDSRAADAAEDQDPDSIGAAETGEMAENEYDDDDEDDEDDDEEDGIEAADDGADAFAEAAPGTAESTEISAEASHAGEPASDPAVDAIADAAIQDLMERMRDAPDDGSASHFPEDED